MRVYADSGQPLDATFSAVAVADGFELIYESRGGTLGTVSARNSEYNAGLDVLLARLAGRKAIITDAVVDSRDTRNLSPEERRLELASGYPLRIAAHDPVELRLELSRTQRSVGRRPEAKGAGNRTRRLRLSLAIPTLRITGPEVESLLSGLAGSDIAEAETAIAAIARGSGQGFNRDPLARRAVERHAVELAIAHYEADWEVADVGDYKSYDLQCRRAEDELRVEVKGTTSTGQTVMVTRNEVLHALAHQPRVSLFVVSRVQLERSGGVLTASGGEIAVYEPWLPTEESLQPLAYRHTVG